MNSEKIKAYQLISGNTQPPYSFPINKKIQKTIMFLVTEDCQLRCKYCYVIHKNKKNKLDFETFKNAFHYILEDRYTFFEPGVNFIFFGGEPLLEIKLINNICEYIKQTLNKKNHTWEGNYRFSMTTNGILYSNPEVQEFIKKNRDHLDISITIDGIKTKHDLHRIYPDGKGSYEDVKRNISLWMSQFPDAATKATVSHEDLPYIKESVLHIWSLGIKNININCMSEDVWKEGDDILLEDQLKQLADHIIENRLYEQNNCSFFNKTIGMPLAPENNENWCGCGKHMMAIDTYGNFFACNRFLPFTLPNRESRLLGNMDTGIDKNKLRPYIALDRLSQSPKQCKECEFASGCVICVGLNYISANSDTIYKRAVYACNMHKARCRANKYYWEKRKYPLHRLI